MKKMLVRILCSTGITLIVLAFVGMMSGARFLCISSVFESFAANIVIHVGFLFTRRFESNYTIIEYMIDLSYIIGVLLVFGAGFDWFDSTPIWMLMIIAAIVYALGLFLSITRMRQDIKEINVLLSKKNKETKCQN